MSTGHIKRSPIPRHSSKYTNDSDVFFFPHLSVRNDISQEEVTFLLAIKKKTNATRLTAVQVCGIPRLPCIAVMWGTHIKARESLRVEPYQLFDTPVRDYKIM
ncbi:unnamed protein product [Timema podura]|uniref:Uncharacterized protein n=1 Tax=Timema podura TaxID=61482 RepID=A0ABN7NL26_TIMPD|nr:unnamed protein product [Timema podura]